MIYLITALVFSVIANIFMVWYVYKVLAKLLYTSDNLGDLYVTFRIYEDFVKSLYGMDMFHGEPILEELFRKIKFVGEEIEKFEEIYGLTTDVAALEEELEDDGNSSYSS
tara:strand:- start:292 stop:621 length:330 start_codon:yes stop_codon:yes gene_type:complete